MNIYLKFCITAALIVLISEIAKLNDKLGSLLASLPLMTFLTLFWLHFEQQGNTKIANHAYYGFCYFSNDIKKLWHYITIIIKPIKLIGQRLQVVPEHCTA